MKRTLFLILFSVLSIALLGQCCPCKAPPPPVIPCDMSTASAAITNLSCIDNGNGSFDMTFDLDVTGGTGLSQYYAPAQIFVSGGAHLPLGSPPFQYGTPKTVTIAGVTSGFVLRIFDTSDPTAVNFPNNWLAASCKFQEVVLTSICN